MKQRVIVGSSHLFEKLDALRREKEAFEASELKKRLDNEWKITSAQVKHKRPRIKRTPKQVRISVGGFIEITLNYGEWASRGSLGTILEEIY